MRRHLTPPPKVRTPQLSPVPGGVPGIPPLTNASIEAARRDLAVGCLIDELHPGRPLLLSFAYVNWDDFPAFDFYGRTKKLEARTGLPFNRILVRDLRNAWYHLGVPGLGDHVDEVAASLRALIQVTRPSRVVCLGQSMGGYAALLFGMLLDADQIVAFGPLSTIDVAALEDIGDLRFLPALRPIADDPPKSYYPDLVALGEETDYRGEIHLVVGTHPGVDDGASTNLDAVHAARMTRLSNVTIHPYPAADHLIVPWLVDQGRMDECLSAFLGGSP